MNNELTNKFVSSFSKGLRPIDTRPLWEWLTDNVVLPNVYNPSGTFHIDYYPYLKRPLLDFTNDSIKQVNLISSTQAGKSLSQELFIPYIILESPGPLLKIHDTGDNSKKVIEERVIPLLNNNKDTKRLLNSHRFSARKTGIQLPHMTFRCVGPAESNIHGYSARIILADEVWRWQADNHIDIISKLKARQTAFNATKKFIISSQPDIEGSELHKEAMKGMWWEYGYRCPSCNTLQLYEWNGEKDGHEYGMIMDKTELDINNTKDYNKKAGSARLVCQHCFYNIKDTPSIRKSLVTNGDYILIHTGPDRSINTYSWNQFVNLSIPFKQIALQYLEAVIETRTTRLRNKQQLFRQQTLGKFWKVGEVIDTPVLMTEAYSSSDEWTDETIRFLTIDPQKDYINWLVRAWSNKVSECRLIDWGTVAGFSEIEEIITKYKIHPLCIGVDSGNDTREIYKETVQRGKVIKLNNNKQMFAQWTCLRGDGGLSPISPKKFYKHKIMDSNKNIIEIDRLYSTKTEVDCQWAAGSKFKGIRAHLYNWSNYSIKTILQNLRDHKINFKWALNDRANGDYTNQMFSEELNFKSQRFEQIHDKNHVWDMECMQLVMALQAACFVPSASSMNELTDEPKK